MINIRPGEPSGLCPDDELVNQEVGTDERQLPEAPQRRARVVRPPLVQDPRLGAFLDEVESAMADDSSGSYFEPPPLIARLALPLSHGRWQVLHTGSAPPPEAGSIREVDLENLDGEWLDDPAGSDSFAPPPPLVTRLPGPTRASARDTVGEWMVSATLILLMFAGAAAGALVFHERLSVIVFQWEARLK